MWLGSSLNIQFSGIIVVPHGGSIPPFDINISRPAEHKVTVIASKSLTRESVGVMVNGVTLISTS